MDSLRQPLRPDRVRTIPRSFSWIDREILHQGYLARLEPREISLYFFLALVAGPEGTSYWSYKHIAKLLKLSVEEVLQATGGLIERDLIAFRYPTFQVLSLPERRRG